MQSIEALILEWATRMLRFSSPVDAKLFASNGALIMHTAGPESTSTYNIVAEDDQHQAVFLNITNAEGSFSFENLDAWLTGHVRGSGIAATFSALSAPPRTRIGRSITRVRSIQYRARRQRNGWVYLDLRAAQQTGPSGTSRGGSRNLGSLTYDKYLQTDHWFKVRDAAIKRANSRCALCNSQINLHVHHRTYERLGHELPADLTVLCSACHDRFHDTLPAPPMSV